METMGSMVFSSILLLIISRKHGKHGKHRKQAWKAWEESMESMGFMQMNLDLSGYLVTWLAPSPWKASLILTASCSLAHL